MGSSRKELVNVMTSRSVKRKRRRRVRWFAVVCALLLIGSIGLGGLNMYMTQGMAPLIMTSEQAAQGGYDCILVLGCQVWPGGAPSHMLEDRCRRGVELYHAGAAPVIIMSGDHGQWEYDEVSAMKQYAVNSGVPSSNVFMDHAGFSTYDSIYRARDIFGAKHILIVTQEYHMGRALYIAQKLDLAAHGVTSDYRPYATQKQNSFREWFARGKAFFSCVFKPQPKFLGDPIPLSLDGDLTNDKGVVFEARG